MKVGTPARRRELAHRGQLLHAGAGRVGVEDADADAALVQARARSRSRMPPDLGLARDVLHPAPVAHGAAERFERGFLVRAGHGADAREGPVGRGAVVQHAPLLGLAPVPGRNRHHPGFEVERGGDAVEGLHAVGGDRLAVGVQVDEARARPPGPAASITRSAPPSPVPTAAIRPSRSATSHTASIPLAGSTTRPPTMIVPLIRSPDHCRRLRARPRRDHTK